MLKVKPYENFIISLGESGIDFRKYVDNEYTLRNKCYENHIKEILMSSNKANGCIQKKLLEYSKKYPHDRFLKEWKSWLKK